MWQPIPDRTKSSQTSFSREIASTWRSGGYFLSRDRVWYNALVIVHDPIALCRRLTLETQEQQETLALAHAIIDILASRMGVDIVLLDIQAITLIADYFIIASGESDRQLNALSDAVVEQIEQERGRKPLSVEGTAASGWMLLDYGAIVVHLFSTSQRAFYQLEELWSQGRTIVRMA
jgi:ribosome-associated protein